MSTDAVVLAETNPLAIRMIAELDALVKTQEVLGTSNLSSAEFVMSIMDNILAAESIDDIFAAQDAGGLTSSKDYLERPFLLGVDGIEWNRSGEQYLKAGNFPFWARLTVIDLEDETERIISCGAPSACTVLRRLEMDDYLSEPMTLKFVGKDAGAGTVVTIRPVKLLTASENGRKKK
jgi:hypothetical protein